MQTLSLLVFLWGGALSALPSQEDVARNSEGPVVEPPGIEVTFLANEGFLLRSGEDAVLIDAFLATPYSSFAALEADALERMIAHRSPFDSVDLALTSHVHGDHFQPDPARQFLSASKDCVFASTPQVLGRLQKGWSGSLPDNRTRTLWPLLGIPARLEVGNIFVEVLQLSHGTGRFASIQNLGHVITLGGMTVLHLGDAAMDERSFTPHGLEGRDLDIALIPYWYFADEDGVHIVEEHVNARHVIACHVPPKELDSVRDLLATEHPEVLLLEKCMESRRFSPGSASGTPEEER